ncbi:mitochondrial ribosomal subunit protein-domain-containing protein [Xylaria intraflava]|nr:mitochondrial ribosomal subunit protein-domain-containing protein [Xylaria intraflava]
MASAVQSMRLCLRVACRRIVAPPTSVAPRRYLTIRPFSSTSVQRRVRPNDEDEAQDEDEDEMQEDDGFEIPSDMDPAELESALQELREDEGVKEAGRIHERVVNNVNDVFVEAMRTRKPRRDDFWLPHEDDPDYMDDEGPTEKFEEDDIMPIAHAKLEEYREYREYARIAAWQMPLLSKLATAFQAPTAQEVLRFRYTSYMGELHPAEKKVVVEFCPRDLPLNEAQQQKLRKLLGPRLNPETDIAKMSCEQFEHPAQNKRYLGDLVNKLVAQAKDPTDMFEDIPLDTRHHTFKVKPKFPIEWRMTEERRKFIDDTRAELLLLDNAKIQAGTLVDGVEKIKMYHESRKEVPAMAATTAMPRMRGSRGNLQPPVWRRA